MDTLKKQPHPATCRSCAVNTDRVWARMPSRPGVPLCAQCTKKWEGSGERERADRLAENATKAMNPEDRSTQALLSGIYGRAMVDFLYRMQKERLESAGKAVSP